MQTIEFQTKIENGIITVPNQFDIPNQFVKIAIFDKDNKDKDILHIEIDNQLKDYFTISSIQNYLEQQLQFLLLEQVKTDFDKKISESGLDNELIMERAKEQAWDSYRDYFLKGVKID